jgi:dTDP-4-amino-4,6-dideoxygalactose transaminase
MQISSSTVRGVPFYSGTSSEVDLEKAFEDTTFRPAERLPAARRLGDASLIFLVYPTLTDVEIDRTRDGFAEVVGEASR